MRLKITNNIVCNKTVTNNVVCFKKMTIFVLLKMPISKKVKAWIKYLYLEQQLKE